MCTCVHLCVFVYVCTLVLFSVQWLVFGVRRSAFGVRRSAFGVRRSAFGVRRSAFGVRRSAFGVLRLRLRCVSLHGLGTYISYKKPL